jgi:hypothetical protein
MRRHQPDYSEERSRLSLIGFEGLRVDAIWSNGNWKAYCLACRYEAPAPAVEMALDSDIRCAACGRRLDEGELE